MPCWALAVGLLSSTPAAAEVRGAVAAAAGVRGTSSYQAVEARLEAARPHWRMDLALRGQWHDGRWRREDFTTAAGWASAVRALEWTGGDAELSAALAAGGLRPAALAQVSDGVAAGLDDARHAGVRARLSTARLELRGEVDDVVAPRLYLASATATLARWELVAASAVGTGGALRRQDAASLALELAVVRRFEGAAPTRRDGPSDDRDDRGERGGPSGERDGDRDDRGERDGPSERARLGSGVVVEPRAGVHAVAFAELAAEPRGWHLEVRADVRAGTGSLGTRFGPLALAGGEDEELAAAPALGGGISGRVHGAHGWGEAALRRGPGGAVVSAHLALAVSERLHVGAWLAADPRRALGAAEARAFAGPRWGRWLSGTFAALEVSRLSRVAEEQAASASMLPAPSWAAVLWLGAGT
ncbi:MAG: hypothetical protein IPI49_18885 [Myxococcales bacterium]|nr:hypothetical protein [Myxococcales bacterium]